MGKIRIKTLGDEDLEKEQKKEARFDREARQAKKRKEAKQVEAGSSHPTVGARLDAPVAQHVAADVTKETLKTTKAKKPIKTSTTAKKRSKKYQIVSKLIEKGKTYSLDAALDLLPKLKLSNFDETVELHINTTETGVHGNLTLPHGTGKKVRVAIASDDLIAQIEKGKIDFDVLLAEPSMMPKLAKVARILGPRGLMPNPKNGTISADPERLALSFAKGQINFKTEKAPIIHLAVGKLSFGDKKLSENIKTALKAISANKIKKVTLKSTMSPGLIINLPLD